MDPLEYCVRRLEDRAQICDLVLRYAFAVDEHDFSALRSMFTSDGVFRTDVGRVKGNGITEIMNYFEHLLPRLGVSNHVVHGHIVQHDDNDCNLAHGKVSSHAEMLWENGRPVVAALRYSDTYRRVNGEWRFAERIQAFIYFTDIRDYASAMSGAGHTVEN